MNEAEKQFNHVIGQRLFEARVMRALSQAELGSHIGVSWQQMQKYEKGINKPTPWKLVTLAKALGVQMVDLLEEGQTDMPVGESQRRMLRIMNSLQQIRQRRPGAFNAICNVIYVLTRS